MGAANLRPFLAFLLWLVLALLYALGAGVAMARRDWPAIRLHSLAVLQVRALLGSKYQRRRGALLPAHWLTAHLLR